MAGACATDVEPLSPMEKTLYAIDELTGFVTACAGPPVEKRDGPHRAVGQEEVEAEELRRGRQPRGDRVAARSGSGLGSTN